MNSPDTTHSEENSNEYIAVVQPLPRIYRRLLFIAGCLVFAIAVPLFILYAIGYRFDPFTSQNGITITGGLYIGTLANDGEIYLNDEPTRGSRIFLSGVYLQNVAPGVQEVHVQAPGLQTWVKDLAVFPHIVTEAQAFLLPVQPQVRVVASSTYNQAMVLPPNSIAATSTKLASSSNEFIAYNPTIAASQYDSNSEFAFLTERFEELVYGTTTGQTVPRQSSFSFSTSTGLATSTQATSTVIATSTKEQSNTRLYLRDGELFVQYLGNARSIPEYFCVPNHALASTTELYGAHVEYGIEYATKLNMYPQPPNSNATRLSTTFDNQVCRHEIRLDTKYQTVHSFYFAPDSTDFVLMHLDDGVYMVEVDDRAWQNVQPLYLGPVAALLVDNNSIYIEEAGLFMELYTSLHSS